MGFIYEIQVVTGYLLALLKFPIFIIYAAEVPVQYYKTRPDAYPDNLPKHLSLLYMKKGMELFSLRHTCISYPFAFIHFILIVSL
jgi:hypothetical protein